MLLKTAKNNFSFQCLDCKIITVISSFVCLKPIPKGFVVCHGHDPQQSWSSFETNKGIYLQLLIVNLTSKHFLHAEFGQNILVSKLSDYSTSVLQTMISTSTFLLFLWLLEIEYQYIINSLRIWMRTSRETLY